MKKEMRNAVIDPMENRISGCSIDIVSVRTRPARTLNPCAVVCRPFRAPLKGESCMICTSTGVPWAFTMRWVVPNLVINGQLTEELWLSRGGGEGRAVACGSGDPCQSVTSSQAPSHGKPHWTLTGSQGAGDQQKARQATNAHWSLEPSSANDRG